MRLPESAEENHANLKSFNDRTLCSSLQQRYGIGIHTSVLFPRPA